MLSSLLKKTSIKVTLKYFLQEVKKLKAIVKSFTLTYVTYL